MWQRNDWANGPPPHAKPLTLVNTMLKLTLWIGTPSFLAFVGSTYSALLENIHFFFLLSVTALLIAILPRLAEARVRR